MSEQSTFMRCMEESTSVMNSFEQSFNNGMTKVFYPLLAGVWLTLFALLFAVCWSVTVVGLPFAYAWLKFAYFAFWPFGRTLVRPEQINGLAKAGNILWLIANCIPLGFLFFWFWASMFLTPGDKQLDKVFALGFQPFGKRIVKIKK